MARNLTQIFVNKETICRRFRLPLLVLFVRAIFWLMRIIVIRHLHAAHLSPTAPPKIVVHHRGPSTHAHTHTHGESIFLFKLKCLFNGFAFHFSGPRHMSAVCLRRRRLFGQGCRKKARKHKRNART